MGIQSLFPAARDAKYFNTGLLFECVETPVLESGSRQGSMSQGDAWRR